jgi:hypothetical protein
MDISPVARNFNANDVFSSWDSALAQSFSPRHTHGAANNCSSSVESQSGTCPTSEAIEQEIMLPTLRAMPDFAQVYNFLGSIFDPETSGHLQRLREMDPIDVETVLLLMKNLSINLTNPNFEAHRKVLASHGSGMDQVKHENLGDLGSTHTLHLPFMVTTK